MPICTHVTERECSSVPLTTPRTITAPSATIAVNHPSVNATAFVTPPFEASRTITPTIVHG
jgi:hypothetical protein